MRSTLKEEHRVPERTTHYCNNCSSFLHTTHVNHSCQSDTKTTLLGLSCQKHQVQQAVTRKHPSPAHQHASVPQEDGAEEEHWLWSWGQTYRAPCCAAHVGKSPGSGSCWRCNGSSMASCHPLGHHLCYQLQLTKEASSSQAPADCLSFFSPVRIYMYDFIEEHSASLAEIFWLCSVTFVKREESTSSRRKISEGKNVFQPAVLTIHSARMKSSQKHFCHAGCSALQKTTPFIFSDLPPKPWSGWWAKTSS